MSSLTWIVLACLFGGLLSILTAAFITRFFGSAQISLLVSFAIGVMLGAAFIEILPHAFSRGDNADKISFTLLIGILAFFLLEKMVIWRHCHSQDHDHPCEAHGSEGQHNDHGRSGAMILIGDTFHNFVDGVLIAAAFMEDTALGVVTTVAITTHEIPQTLGNFLVVIQSGFTRKQALLLNLLASLAMLIGGILAYFTLQSAQNLTPYFLIIAAASMIYVAIADLMPGLHQRSELKVTLQQITLILAGVFLIWAVPLLFGGHEHTPHELDSLSTVNDSHSH